MKKNVIVVIVEGKSDSIVLSKSLSGLLKNDKVNVIIAGGDITSKKNVTSNNIISHINNFVKEEIETNFYKKSDVSKLFKLLIWMERLYLIATLFLIKTVKIHFTR